MWVLGIHPCFSGQNGSSSFLVMWTEAEIIIQMNVRNVDQQWEAASLWVELILLKSVDLTNDIIILLRWNAHWQWVSLNLSLALFILRKITALLQLYFLTPLTRPATTTIFHAQSDDPVLHCISILKHKQFCWQVSKIIWLVFSKVFFNSMCIALCTMTAPFE